MAISHWMGHLYSPLPPKIAQMSFNTFDLSLTVPNIEDELRTDEKIMPDGVLCSHKLVIQVEVPGIEPGSFGIKTGLLRA